MEELWTSGWTADFDPGRQPALGFELSVASALWTLAKWRALEQTSFRVPDSITVLRFTSAVCDGIFRFFSVC